MLDLKGFTWAILPVALAPGASFTLAMSNFSATGLKGATRVIIGTGLGLLVHALLVGFGISAVLSRSDAVMDLLRTAGILFLLWLALELMNAGIRPPTPGSIAKPPLAGIREAVSLNLLNAKTIFLYLTVVPTFAGAELKNFLLLSSVHIAIMAAWIMPCVGLLSAAKKDSRWT